MAITSAYYNSGTSLIDAFLPVFSTIGARVCRKKKYMYKHSLVILDLTRDKEEIEFRAKFRRSRKDVYLEFENNKTYLKIFSSKYLRYAPLLAILLT